MSSLLSQFPALQIVVPMMAAPLCVLFRKATFAWIIAFIANLVAVFIATALLINTSDGSYIRYALGGWAAPTGIEYYVDALNASILLVVSAISLLALAFSYKSAAKEVEAGRLYLFYTGWLLCLTGLLGIVITGDLFNVFVFLEISSLSTYMLIALGYEKRYALLAAFRYLIIGSIGASFILIGIGFLYAATGSLNMVDLAERIPAVESSRTVFVGFTFLTLGVLIKAAIFPLHAWLPNAYQYAPSAVTVFLAGTATKVSVYVLVRIFFNIFSPDYSFGDMLIQYVLLPLTVVGFIVMSMVAIFQRDLRRMLAYSSLAQIAYIVTGIALFSIDGLAAATIHVVNHAMIKAALFMAVGCIVYRMGSAHLDDLAGLFKVMPATCFAFTLAGLGLIGVPLTAGFISKWTLIQAILNEGLWPLVVLILASSLMAIVYVGKAIEIFYFRDSQSEVIERKEAPWQMQLPMWLLVAAIFYTGIDANTTVSIANTAAIKIMGGF